MQFTQRISIPYPEDGRPYRHQELQAQLAVIDGALFSSVEDRNLFMTGGGTFGFSDSSDRLTWSESIRFVTPTTGALQTLAAGYVEMANGQMAYVTLVRGATAAGTLTARVATKVEAGTNRLVFAYRIGDVLYLRNGLVLRDGETVNLSGGRVGNWVEEEFELDDVTWSWELANTPIDGTMVVFLDGKQLKQVASDPEAGEWVLGDGGGAILELGEYPTYRDMSGCRLTVRYAALAG